MKQSKIKKEKREKRHSKIRTRIQGTAARPRLSVYKSNKYLYAQLIDDDKGTTLVTTSTRSASGKSMLEKAKHAGIDLAKKAHEKKIKVVVFDRGGFIYTGRIRALADGAREGGLKF